MGNSRISTSGEYQLSSWDPALGYLHLARLEGSVDASVRTVKVRADNDDPAYESTLKLTGVAEIEVSTAPTD